MRGSRAGPELGRVVPLGWVHPAPIHVGTAAGQHGDTHAACGIAAEQHRDTCSADSTAAGLHGHTDCHGETELQEPGQVMFLLKMSPQHKAVVSGCPIPAEPCQCRAHYGGEGFWGAGQGLTVPIRVGLPPHSCAGLCASRPCLLQASLCPQQPLDLGLPVWGAGNGREPRSASDTDCRAQHFQRYRLLFLQTSSTGSPGMNWGWSNPHS